MRKQRMQIASRTPAQRPLHIGCMTAAAVRRRRSIFTPQLPHPEKHRHRPQRALWPNSESPFALAAGPRPANMFGRAASFTSSHSDADAWTGAPCEQLCSARLPLVRGKGGCQSLLAVGRMQGRGRGMQGRGVAGRRKKTPRHHKPCPRFPQAGHPQLPPHALESSLGAWQPDAKRRRVGPGVSGKPGPCLHRPPPALPR